MSTLQKDLDALQVRYVGRDATQADMAEYFNRCLNSACGIVGHRCGDDAVYGLLLLWMQTIEAKMEAKGKARQ